MVILATLKTTLRGFRLIRWFGRNSYEIYLTHSFVVLLSANILYRSGQSIWLTILEYIIIVLCSGLVGQLIASYYSEPLNRYIRASNCMRGYDRLHT